jgi:uncharacterized OB-fold protein
VSQPVEATPATAQLSRCRACGAASHPRKCYCPSCGSADLVEEPLPDTAEIYSHTRIPGATGDRWVALVNAGDVRVMVAVTPGAPALAVGDRVRLTASPGTTGIAATPLP